MEENKKVLLASKVVSQLLMEIKEGQYRYAHRLPPEIQLAKELHVSRTAMRDALSAMEQKGYISRRRGTGTIINRHVVNVAVRFDGEEEFLSIVEKSGYLAGLHYIGSQMAPAGERIAKWLGISPEDTVLVVSRMIAADAIPVIYCKDYIPAKLIQNENYTQEDLEKPIFYFLEHFCGLEGSMDLTQIHARNASAEVAQVLKLEENTAVLYFDEAWYDFDGMCILYAEEYYREGMIPQTILRKGQDKY